MRAFSVATGFILTADSVERWAQERKWVIKLGQASYDCYLWQSLFLPLPFAAATVPLMQQIPISYAMIALCTMLSFTLTFPRRNLHFSR